MEKEIARYKIADALAIGYRVAQRGKRRLLEPQIAVEQLAYVFADQELVQILQVRQPVEKENPLDQLVGVLHLVDRLLVLVDAKLSDPPVPQHPCMQEILVDGGQFILENRIEMLDDGRVAAHSGLRYIVIVTEFRS